MKYHYLLNKVKAKYTLLTENQDSIKAEVIKFRLKSVVKLGLSVGNMAENCAGHDFIIDKYHYRQISCQELCGARIVRRQTSKGGKAA